MKRTPPDLKSEVRNPKAERKPPVAPQPGGGGKPEIRVGARKSLAGVMMGVLLVVNVAWGQANYATPYTFTTIAGTVGSRNNVDGTNNGAQFWSPTGVTLGTNGILYVVDYNENTVRKVAPVGTNWVVTTIAGSAGVTGYADGTNDNATFNQPVGIAADGAGNLYVTDTLNNTIRRLAPLGTNWVVTTIAGTANPNGGFADGTNGAAQFDLPYGIAADAAGNLYVADTVYNIIRRVSLIGTNWVVTTIAGTANVNGGSRDGTNGAAQFYLPYAVAVDPSGNLFVADGGNNIIRKITPAGTNWVTTTIAGTANIIGGFADGTNSAAAFSSPFGIAVDTNDNVYVADSYNNAIRKVSPVGTNWVSTTLAGSAVGFANGTGARAKFSYPWGIAVDSTGNLYVADASNDVIREGISAALINLTIGLTATNSVVVSWWPGAFATLQTNASLTSSNWGNYVGTVVGSNGTNSVNLPAAGGTMFFQLSN